MTTGESPEGLDDLEDETFFDAPAEFEGESADDSPPGGRVPEECEDFVERDKLRPVFGRLRGFSALRFWRALPYISVMVLSWIEVGYKLPWIDGIPCAPARFENKPDCFGESAFGPRDQFLDTAVVALQTTGATLECDSEFLKVVSPIGVIQQRDKLRMIANMRYVNRHLQWPRFRYEGLNDLQDILAPSDWLFSVDMQSAYHHVEMHRDSWPYLGFSWRGKFYHFRVLCFGLGPAPWVFTKITQPLVRKWRSAGLHVLPYLDDFVGGGRFDTRAEDPQHVLRVRHTMLADFRDAGFLLAASKCKLEPTQVITHLGMVIRMFPGVPSFRVPRSRFTELHKLIEPVLVAGGATARQLARIAGKAQSFKLAMGSVVSFYTRHIHFLVDSRTTPGYGYWLPLNPEVTWALEQWMGLDSDSYTSPIWPAVHRISVTASSDAGDRGWGAILHAGQTAIARGFLLPWQRQESSTWRELHGILQALQSFEGFLRKGDILRWHSDSQNAVIDMQKGGSRVPAIHALCLQIFEFTVRHGIEIKWSWIPRDQNTWADALAGVNDKNDWKLHVKVFRILDALWGFHTIDRFASDLNKLCELFNSQQWCPGTGGVDAFAQTDWLLHNNWCNPPFWLIGRLLRFLRARGASATIIVPHWPGRQWWPLLCPDGVHFDRFVVDWRELIASPGLFASGWHSGNTAGCKMPGYRFFALRVSFEASASAVRPRSTCTMDAGLCSCGQPRQAVISVRHTWP